jgi:hypothetical protein
MNKQLGLFADPAPRRSRWLEVFWREPDPAGSQIDGLAFQVRRDLAALEDGPDPFLEARVAEYRALIARLRAETTLESKD